MISKAGIFILVAAGFLLWHGLCFAATEPSTRLNELLGEALKNNPDIQAARNNVEAAKALKPQAWGLDNPTLRLENENAHRNPFDAKQSEQNRIGFMQALPFPAKLFGRAALADRELEMAKAQYAQAVNDVMREVKKAYADLFSATHTKELLEESRAALDEFGLIANRKYSIGKASQAAVLGAEVERGKVLNDIATQEAQEITAQSALKALMNRPEDRDLAKPQSRDVNPMQPGVEELVIKAVKTNPSLQSAHADVGKAQASFALAQLEFAPDVQIQSEFRQVDGGPDLWEGFLGISVPLWAWKQQGMIAQAKAILDKKKNDLSTQRNKTILAVREAYARTQSAWHIVNNLKTIIVPQAEQTLKVSQTAYENDKIDFIALVTYWRLLLNYRIELIGATARYEIAIADLERAVGEARAESL